MKKPTLEQVSWVLKKLVEHMEEGGTYRYLIYDRMGYGFDAYSALFPEGMILSNAFSDLNIEKLVLRCNNCGSELVERKIRHSSIICCECGYVGDLQESTFCKEEEQMIKFTTEEITESLEQINIDLKEIGKQQELLASIYQELIVKFSSITRIAKDKGIEIGKGDDNG